jgi:hypothetical protein
MYADLQELYKTSKVNPLAKSKDKRPRRCSFSLSYSWSLSVGIYLYVALLGGTFTEDLKPQTLNFKCFLAEQRSKTELIGNRLGKSYRRATRLRPRMEGRGHQGSGGCTLQPAIHPPRDRFARR